MGEWAGAQPTNPGRIGLCPRAWRGHVCTLPENHKGAHHSCFCGRRFFKAHEYRGPAGVCKVCGQPASHDWHLETAA